MRVISYVTDRYHTTGTDVSTLEFIQYLQRKWGDGFNITHVLEISKDDLKRWQSLGCATILRSQMNGN